MSVTEIGASVGRRALPSILMFLVRPIVAFLSQRVLRPRLEPMLALADRWHHERTKLGSGWRALNDEVEFDLDFADLYLPAKKESGAESVITLRKRQGLTKDVSDAQVTVEVFGVGDYGEKLHLQADVLFKDVRSFEKTEAEGCLRRSLAIEPQTFRCENGLVHCKYDKVRVTLESLTVNGHPTVCGESVTLHLTLSDHFAHDDGWTVRLWGRHWHTKLFQTTQSELRGTIKRALLTVGEQHGMIRVGLWGNLRKSLLALLTLPRVSTWLFWVLLTLHLIVPDREGSILDNQGNISSRIRGLSIRRIRRCIGVRERDPYEGW